MIQDPNKRNNKKDIVNEMIEKAKKQAQNPHEPLPQGETTFTGAGYRLDNNAVEPVKPIVNIDPPKQRNSTLTFWKNGFQVDDGPLRAYDDPANRQFLTDINNGIVPRELNIQSDIDVSLVDRKGDDYVPPKSKIPTFTGSGRTLNSSTPTTTPPVITPAAPISRNLVVEAGQPQTTIQIRLADGTKLVAKFNLTHTIQDIINFVAAAKRSGPFQLMTVYPQKTLDKPNQTIAEAQLQNAAVVQKLL